MSEKKKTIKQVVRKFLNEEAKNVVDVKDIPQKNIQWIFVFQYPPSTPKSESPQFQLTKFKKKKWMLLATKVGLSEEEANIFKQTKMDLLIFAAWKKILLGKVIDYNIIRDNMSVEMFLRIYLDDDGLISEEKLYFELRKFFFAGLEIITTAFRVSGTEEDVSGNHTKSNMYS